MEIPEGMTLSKEQKDAVKDRFRAELAGIVGGGVNAKQPPPLHESNIVLSRPAGSSKKAGAKKAGKSSKKKG
ncbi:MAG TPA: hypothetical protein VGX48_08385 [Pyrinomonadaceae bacterium]|nr:hypothetical protein [Pyrinomonadaceae bacterium]